MSQNIYTEAWKKILRDASLKMDAQGSLKVSYPAAQITSLGDRGAYAGRFNAQHGKCTYYKDSAPFRDLKSAFETGTEFREAFPGYLEIVLNAQDEITITHQREHNLAAKEETTISAPELLQKTQSMNHPLNLILYGPPGTGKTYHTVNKALEIVDPAFYEANKNNRKQLTSRFKELLIGDWTNPAGRIAFVTFHQSSSYEDFIEGIKPVVIEASDNEPGYITYEVKDGLFKLIAEKASWRSGNFDRVFTEFKESINELKEKKPLTITSKYTTFDVIFRETTVLYVKPLSSKKENAWYPVSIVNLRKVYETGDYEGVYNPTYVREILQYLKDKKGLTQPTATNSAAPEPHVLIIDEINRGNIAQIFGELITLLEPNKRSGAEEELHVVLPYSKKPFSVPDNLYVIGTMNTADRSVEALDTALRRRFSFKEMMPQYDLDEIGTVNIAGTDIDFKEVLRTINKRLEKLVGRDHKIGHSYFMSEQEEAWEFYLKAFKDKIIPLLQEYFYGDYAKMCLVIGKGFVDVHSALSDGRDDKFFASAEHDALDDFKAKKVWEIKSIATEQEFATALVTLLNK